jgi:ubiquinone/menaquinone biosynthesis C-methylase UbiE
MSTKIDYFDKRAASWMLKEREEEKKIVEEIFDEYIPELSGNILDLGCGTGFLQPVIAKRRNKYSSVFCADTSLNMLNILHSRYSDCIPVNGDALYMPFQDDFFKKILCYNVFPHFIEKDGVINEFKRVLAVGGVIYIIHNMCHRKLNGLHLKKGVEVSNDRMLPVDNLKQLFLNQSFQIIHSEENQNRYLLIAQK